MQGKDLPKRSAGNEVYVGIDVCKDWLDVHIHPTDSSLRVANTRDGIRRLTRELAGFSIRLVVMEATAKYHRLVHRMLSAIGFSVSVVNPLRARLFAEASGQLAKTDRLDARLLAILGESLKPEVTQPPSQLLETLQELVRARQAATAESAALQNRLSAAQVSFLRAELNRRLRSLKTHIKRLEAEIFRLIESDAVLKRRYEVLLSIPGIGRISAMTLVVELNELGVCSGKAVALIAGVAPIACDTGQKFGQRRIRGGRASARRTLYMAALTAAHHNPDLAAFHQRLIAKGKAQKVALTAVMRKLIVLANTLISQDREWQPKPPTPA